MASLAGLHATSLPSLTAAQILLHAPLALLLSTKITTAPLPLFASAQGHIAGKALSSSSTTPSATSTSSSALFLFLFFASLDCPPVLNVPLFHRLYSFRAGTQASKSTRSTIDPPSCSWNSARMLVSEASMGTLAMKRLRSSVEERRVGSCGLMYR